MVPAGLSWLYLLDGGPGVDEAPAIERVEPAGAQISRGGLQARLNLVWVPSAAAVRVVRSYGVIQQKRRRGSHMRRGHRGAGERFITGSFIC